MKRSIEPKIVLHTSPSAQNSDGSYPVVIELVHKSGLFCKRLGFRAFPNQWDNERYISDKRIVRDYNERNAVSHFYFYNKLLLIFSQRFH